MIVNRLSKGNSERSVGLLTLHDSCEEVYVVGSVLHVIVVLSAWLVEEPAVGRYAKELRQASDVRQTKGDVDQNFE